MMIPYERMPRLPEHEIRRIRRWHADSYRRSRARSQTQWVDHLGLRLAVPADVMPITDTSHLLGEAVRAEVAGSPGVDHVLDMGTGCGVNALVAARHVRSVVAVDVNPSAIVAARANAVRNALSDRVEVRQSDVFSAVPERFELIVFDPPFRWFAPRDILEVATTDENYRALTEFFWSARKHLTERGRILLFFGTSGHMAYVRWLASETGFTSTTVSCATLSTDGNSVDYRVFRLSPS